MKTLLKLLVVLGLLTAGGYASWSYGTNWLKERNKPRFRTAEVERGKIRITVNATGEVQPVLSIHVGSFVSGPIDELFVDFNDEVKAGQLLAKIDPRIYQAAVARDQAGLATREAEVQRVEAQLQQARNDEQRGDALRQDNPAFISQRELDQLHFARTGLEAQLTIAQANVAQARANLENSQANLQYTQITAPVDGIVIDRKISAGATLAAQFQSPELFIIAPDMREKMHIFASIDEADIGRISTAQKAGRPVEFRIEAYRGELFTEGVIEQIRLSSTNTQNVVTYPVVVATPNKDMKLLPGMTATVTFEVEERIDVLKVPNKAIRYVPLDKAYVVAEDHAKLDVSLAAAADTASDDLKLEDKPIDEVVAAETQAEKRHVWIRQGDKLKAVEIQIGVDDYQFTEVVAGDLQPGDEVVTGLEPKA